MRLANNLKTLIVQEATNIRKFAKKSEIDKLDFEKLGGVNNDCCLYCQMTGDCSSQRARELMSKRTFPYSMCLDEPKETKSFVGNRLLQISFSPIEYLIANSDIYSESLINFIKGKTETIF